MTVVHGPNESGKSTWFAATYAGLAGRRRMRGKPKPVHAEFRSRHEPWAGGPWRAGVTIELDDGSMLALEHDLAKGESRIVDAATQRVVTQEALESRLGVSLKSDNSLDGSRVLGLNRDSIRATVFTGQADVLRVLDDAEQLQEFLERAATSDAADVTAEGALNWLADVRSERVGSSSVGKRPLRARREALEKARSRTSTLRDHLIDLGRYVEQQRTAESELRKRVLDLDLADRAAAWMEIDQVTERIGRARALMAQLDRIPSHEFDVDEDQVEAAAMLLGSYSSGVDVDPLPPGPSAHDLEAQIEALPTEPEGDLEPRQEVLESRDRVVQSVTALREHRASRPEAAEEPSVAAMKPDQLRTLADIMDAAPPVGRPGLSKELAELREQHAAAKEAHDQAVRSFEESRAEFKRALEAHEIELADHLEAVRGQEASSGQLGQRTNAAARTRSPAIIGLGVALLIAGLLLIGVGVALPGALVAGAGLAVTALGVIGRPKTVPGSAPARQVVPLPPAPEPPREDHLVAPAPLTADPRLLEVTVALEVEAEELRRHKDRLGAAHAQLEAHGLPTDSASLRALARRMDDLAGAREREAAHAVRELDLKLDRERACAELDRLLGTTGSGEWDDDHVGRLIVRFENYVAECRARSKTAEQARRRDDLSAAYRERADRESEHASALRARDAQIDAVMTAVRDLELVPKDGSTELTSAEAAELLAQWLESRRVARLHQGDRQKLQARISELLESRQVGDWEQDATALTEAAGSRPEQVPHNLEVFRTTASIAHDELKERIGVLAGTREQLERDLGSVAEALEVESAAERAVNDVMELQGCLDVAMEKLELARSRAHANIAPALERQIRPLLPMVTAGRYLDVSVDPATLVVRVTEASGQVRDARYLSQGTTEQIFLLLRVALARVLSADSETVPIVLDDVTVQSDHSRTIAVLTMLHELSAHHQVVLFTQEQEVVEWADSHLQADRDQVISLVARGSASR